MAGIEKNDRDNILEQVHFGSRTLLVRYLGLPLVSKRMTMRQTRWIHKYLFRKSFFCTVDDKDTLGFWTLKNCSNVDL